MTISFGCPNCNAPLHAPDEYAGGRARCKKCGTKIRIPTSAPDEPDPLADDLLAALAEQSSSSQATAHPPAKPEAKTVPSRQPGGHGRFMAVVAGGAVAVLAIAVTVIVLVKHSQMKAIEGGGRQAGRHS